MPGFGVDAGALGTHAAKVDELTARMRSAAEAGRPLDIGAYGLVGQVFAAAVAGAAGNGSRTVGSLSDTARTIGDGVRATQADYLIVEERNAAVFGGPR
jgi:hypothetical protein